MNADLLQREMARRLAAQQCPMGEHTPEQAVEDALARVGEIPRWICHRDEKFSPYQDNDRRREP